MIRLLRLRRLVQVAVLLLLAALPWLNRDGFTGMKGSLFAFDFFGLPFADPLGAVQIGLSGIIPGWRLIAGALVVLAVALCLGRIFCSWFCPFGFLSELVHAIRGRRPPKPLKHGFRSRAVIALVGLALVPLLGFPLLNQLSLPGGLSLGRRRSALLQNNPHRSGAPPLLCRAVSARDYCARRRACHGRTALVPLGLSAVRPARADGPPARGPASAAHAVPLYLQRRTRLPPRLLARP